MNKRQIIAELRRSATEDNDPWAKCRAWADASRQASGNSTVMLDVDDLRIFYLLVACALEDEL